MRLYPEPIHLNFTQIMGRFLQDKGKCRLSVPPFNSTDLQLKNRTLITPREGNQVPCLWGYRTDAGKQKHVTHGCMSRGAALSPSASPSIWPNKPLFGYGDQSNPGQAGSCFGQVLCYSEWVLPDGGPWGAAASSVITVIIVLKITQELDKSFCSVWLSDLRRQCGFHRLTTCCVKKCLLSCDLN